MSIKKIGELSPAAKLTWDKVNQIREMLTQNVKQAKIAKIFGVHSSTISNIKTGKIWKGKV